MTTRVVICGAECRQMSSFVVKISSRCRHFAALRAWRRRPAEAGKIGNYYYTARPTLVQGRPAGGFGASHRKGSPCCVVACLATMLVLTPNVLTPTSSMAA